MIFNKKTRELLIDIKNTYELILNFKNEYLLFLMMVSFLLLFTDTSTILNLSLTLSIILILIKSDNILSFLNKIIIEQGNKIIEDFKVNNSELLKKQVDEVAVIGKTPNTEVYCLNFKEGKLYVNLNPSIKKCISFEKNINIENPHLCFFSKNNEELNEFNISNEKINYANINYTSKMMIEKDFLEKRYTKNTIYIKEKYTIISIILFIIIAIVCPLLLLILPNFYLIFYFNSIKKMSYVDLENRRKENIDYLLKELKLDFLDFNKKYPSPLSIKTNEIYSFLEYDLFDNYKILIDPNEINELKSSYKYDYTKTINNNAFLLIIDISTGKEITKEFLLFSKKNKITRKNINSDKIKRKLDLYFKK